MRKVGQQLYIPEDNSFEIKQLHDQLIRLKGKAHHTKTYELWTRLYALLPECRKGFWSIRHSLTQVYLVKMAEQDADR